MIYFITAREVGRVKIGYTDAGTRNRFNWISANSPVEVVLEAELIGGFDEEQKLHDRFAPLRVKGEWFALCAEIEAVIADNLIVEPEAARADPDSVEGIVRSFGSASELARQLGVPFTTVASWRQKGRIPAWRMDAVNALISADQG